MHPSSPSSGAHAPRSRHGGRHELGQNFLVHQPTITRIVNLARATDGPILEIGPGSGALTGPLLALGRPLRAVEIDEHRTDELRRRFPALDLVRADATLVPFDRAVIIGNLPFHLTTPLLRKLLREPLWRHAILLTQWEVARKRAGVGGGTMLTAQSGPWFEFRLESRVPAHAFAPMPSVDGGILTVTRRDSPLVPHADRQAYERFAQRLFTARGNGLGKLLHASGYLPRERIAPALRAVGIPRTAMPRDLTIPQWAALWETCRLGDRPGAARRRSMSE